MKLALLGIVLLAGCSSCQTPAPPPPATADQVVYQQLVEGGCLQASDGGLLAVQQEHASPNPPWLQCLYDGGTVGSCSVPCK